MEDIQEKKISALVLDAGPLITQSASSLQQHADSFYTTPGVFSELKDVHARQQLVLWGDLLKIRHPKPEFIKRVTEFSKMTGDYTVLSPNDLHIIALTYEVECELNNGDWRLRKYPGEKKEFQKKEEVPETIEEVETASVDDEWTTIPGKKNMTPVKQALAPVIPVETPIKTPETTSEDAPKKKARRRGGKKQRAKREAELEEEFNSLALEEETAGKQPDIMVEESQDFDDNVLAEEFDDEDDDGDWITPENLAEAIIKDAGEQIVKQAVNTKVKAALATGDFAVQNVSLQIGLNLMNAMSGMQIKRVRNYMFRCHACFRLTPMPKDGTPKHFCSHCGGATLLRCAVSVNSRTGEITPHLKANFEWHVRGNKYSLASPLSKAATRRGGNGGYQHQKEKRQTPVFLREDQLEYQKALKDDAWQRRKNEKILQEWIGGGSADNFISPFTNNQAVRPSGVRVGVSRFINASKKTGK